jgi:carboxy-cis,cis-muconate cyclase
LLLPQSLTYRAANDCTSPGSNNTLYWSAEVTFSPSGKYVWASARGQDGSGKVGYISAFRLDEDGHITKHLFMQPTYTIDAGTNQVSPAFWTDEWVAMADYGHGGSAGTGYVQMWRFDPEAETLTDVAKVSIDDGGCCANIVWYD